MYRFVVTIMASVTTVGLVVLTSPAAHAAVMGPKSPSAVRTLTNDTAAPEACPTGPGSIIDVQVNADGTVSPFTIPDGEVLIITGWQFAEGETPSEATLYISAPTPVGFSTSQGVTSDSHVQLSPGVVVKSGSTLCFFSDSSTTVIVNVYGYVTKDK